MLSMTEASYKMKTKLSIAPLMASPAVGNGHGGGKQLTQWLPQPWMGLLR